MTVLKSNIETINNFYPNTIFRAWEGKGDARNIRSDKAETIANIIIENQLLFKEIDILKPNDNDFNLISPATYMGELVQYIYMYEHELLEIRYDQGNSPVGYTYNEMKLIADRKYKICKHAETVMLANQWRFLNSTYRKATRAYKRLYTPEAGELKDMLDLYEKYKDNPLCSIHTKLLKTVYDKYSFDESKAIAELNNLSALQKLNNDVGCPNQDLDKKIELLEAKIQFHAGKYLPNVYEHTKS